MWAGNREQLRQYVSALSILFVATFVGVPIWWKTTEVYRRPLPYKAIGALHHVKVPPRVSVSVDVACAGGGWEEEEVGAVVEALEDHFTARKVIAGSLTVRVQYNFKTLLLDPSTGVQLLDTFSNQSLEDFSNLARDLIPSSLGHYTILLFPPGARTLEGEAKIFVTPYRHAAVLADRSTALSLTTELVSGVYGDTTQLERVLQTNSGKGQDRVDSTESKRQLRATQGYQVSFTLLDPNPSLRTVQWNIEAATSNILLPFLHHPGIANLGNFTVSSQVFYYTNVQFHPKKDGDGFSVLSSQLPPMISSVESKLGSLVSQFPSLNFLIYVPTPNQSPLRIKNSAAKSITEKNARSTSFLVPQWGGVVFYNPAKPALSNESSDSDKGTVVVKMEKVMPVFIEQLKRLLGLPERAVRSGRLQFGAEQFGITDWQVDQLLIAKMTESASMTTTSLISLIQLVNKVKNMIISDHIQHEVEASLHSLAECHQWAGAGRLQEAYTAAKKALLSAETAFFDPSILELLYFPDDQKYAIYIPLFLPISIPVILSSIAAFKWLASILKARPAAKPKLD